MILSSNYYAQSKKNERSLKNMLVTVEVLKLYKGEFISTYNKSKFKLFSKKKCESCNKKKLCTLIEEDYSSIYGGIGSLKYYCNECSANVKSYHNEFKKIKENEKIKEKVREFEELKEKQRLNYLKKEIEKREIEEKAKLYGITYPEDGDSKKA